MTFTMFFIFGTVNIYLMLFLVYQLYKFRILNLRDSFSMGLIDVFASMFFGILASVIMFATWPISMPVLLVTNIYFYRTYKE